MLLACLLLAQEVDAWIHELRSDRLEIRSAAAARLALAGDAAAPALEALSRDPDVETAARAREVLRAVADLKLLTPALARALPGARERVAGGGRRLWGGLLLEAARHPELGRSDLDPLAPRALQTAEGEAELKPLRDLAVARGLTSAWPEFVRRIREFDNQLCYEWIRTTGELGAREAAPALVELLGDPKGAAWTTTLFTSLRRLEAREAVPKAVAYLHSGPRSYDREHERAAALALVMDLDPGQALRMLVALAGETETSVKAFPALADLSASEALAAARRYLAHEHDHVKALGRHCILSLRSRETIPYLLQFTELPIPEERVAAIQALGALHAREAVPRLRRMLEDGSAVVRRKAAAQLAAFGERDGIPELVMALLRVENRFFDPIPALADAGATEAIPLLREHLDGPRRGPAAWALGRLGDQASADRLRALLKDPDVQVYAAWGLGHLLGAKAIPDLHPLLSSDNDWVRTRIRSWIDDLGEPKDAPEGRPAEIGDVLRREPFQGVELNAHRRPDLWKAWQETTLKGRFKGPAYEAIARAAEQAGLNVEWPASGDEPWMFETKELNLEGRPARRVLAELARNAVFEPGRLRILSWRESRRFWKRWRAERDGNRAEVEALDLEERRELEARAALEKKALPRDVAVTPALAAVPGILERLGRSGNAACLEILLETTDASKNAPYRKLAPADLEPLLAGAFEGARAHAELNRLFHVIAQRRLSAGIPRLSEHLRHEAPLVRAGAARQLADLKGRAAFPEILPLLRDPDAQVKGAAIVILGEKGTKEEHLKLILDLWKEPALRDSIGTALMYLKAKEGIPLLIEQASVEGDAWMVRNSAVLKLRAVAGPAEIPFMRSLIPKHAQRDPNTSDYAIGFLANWGAREAVAEIEPLFAEARRVTYLQTLPSATRDLGLRQLLPHWIRALEKGDTRSVDLLADMGAREAIPALRTKLEGYHGGRVALALAELGDRASVPKIRALLDHEYEGVRDEVGLALATLGDRESWPKIQKDILGREHPINENTLQTLHLFKAPDLKAFVLKHCRHVPYRVEDLLAEIAGDELLPVLRPTLESDAADIRYRALRVVGKLRTPAALRVSEAFLEDPSDYVRRQAGKNLRPRPGRLEGIPFDGPAYASLLEHYGTIAKAAGLKLETPAPGADCLYPLKGRFVRLRKIGAPPTLAWALDALEGERWSAVVEADRLRLEGK